ncbi:MAG: RNA 2',3'-cyclic phosphodiesterase [Candidatus Woesearchaeota archaeon]
MRLFIAIEIPQEAKDMGRRILEKLDDSRLRKVRDEHIHLTLSFLGEVAEKDMNVIIAKLDHITFKPITLKTQKPGFFPANNRIRIVWIGLEMNDAFMQLQKNIRSLSAYKDKFMPHVTIARARQIMLDNKEELAKKLSAIDIPEIEFMIDRFILYQSILTPVGPIHQKIKEYYAI